MKTITKLFPVWAVLLSFVAYKTPSEFTPLAPYIGPGLSLIMLFMGLTLSLQDFLAVRGKLKALSVGVLLQFGIMPFAGLFVAKLLNLPPDLTIGMVLAGSVAGGTASNVLCYLAKGDVALSISMTAVSTLVGSFATPFLIQLLVNEYVEVNTLSLMKGVLDIVVIPVLTGIVINYFCSKIVKKISPILPFLSMSTIVLVIAVIVAANAPSIPTLGPITVLAVILHNSIGLTLGYFATYLLGFDKITRKTVAIEVGLQNSGLAVVLATHFFTPIAALPGTFFSIWHNISGSILAAYWAKDETETEVEQKQIEAA